MAKKKKPIQKSTHLAYPSAKSLSLPAADTAVNPKKIWGLWSPAELKNNLDDVKTFFDWIKHLGVCLTLALGMKYSQIAMIEYNWSNHKIAVCNWIALVLIGGLLVSNYLWLWLSFKATPSSKIIHYSSLLVLIIISAFVLNYLYADTYNELILSLS